MRAIAGMARSYRSLESSAQSTLLSSDPQLVQPLAVAPVSPLLAACAQVDPGAQWSHGQTADNVERYPPYGGIWKRTSRMAWSAAIPIDPARLQHGYRLGSTHPTQSPS
jgi:hypothetical protein